MYTHKMKTKHAFINWACKKDGEEGKGGGGGGGGGKPTVTVVPSKY